MSKVWKIVRTGVRSGIAAVALACLLVPLHPHPLVVWSGVVLLVSVDAWAIVVLAKSAERAMETIRSGQLPSLHIELKRREPAIPTPGDLPNTHGEK